MTYKIVQIAVDNRKTRLKELKAKGTNNLSKEEVAELLDILINLVK